MNDRALAEQWGREAAVTVFALPFTVDALAVAPEVARNLAGAAGRPDLASLAADAARLAVRGAFYAHPDAAGDVRARHVTTRESVTGRCAGPCLGDM